MTVKDVMTRSPITIDPDAPLGTAMATMRDRDVRHLPVVDEQGGLVGMITDRDLRNAAFSPALAEYLSRGAQRRLRGLAQSLDDMRVRDAMTWAVVTTSPGAPLAQAAAIMAEGRFGSLPVVEGGKLIGLVTERDVLKALASTLPAVRGLDPDQRLW
jgi:acetoin utilization protein AcuB